MIYFDNSATGGFKPNDVFEASINALKFLTANPGRSSHRLAMTGANIIYDTRENIADFFGGTANKVCFTKNCTEALNTAIFGTFKKGGHVITTIYEHNSVLRPLSHLKNNGKIELTVVSPNENGDILEPIKNAIKDNTYLVITTAVSNVNGTVLPINDIGKLCQEKNLLYIVDGAQGAGHIHLSLNNGINILCVAGHKGLYAPMGIGAIIFDEKTDISPLTFGGTGTESFSVNQPQTYPEKLESGTLNLPAIAGFNEGVRYVKKNLNQFSVETEKMTRKLIEGLSAIEKVKIYSLPNTAGIVAFSIIGLPSQDVADILNRNYDIAVRGGLHCAPLMHKHLKTNELGLVRASITVHNTTSEIRYFLSAIYNIANAKFS